MVTKYSRGYQLCKLQHVHSLTIVPANKVITKGLLKHFPKYNSLQNVTIQKNTPNKKGNHMLDQKSGMRLHTKKGTQKV